MKIVTRQEWGANPDSLPAKRMTLPAAAGWLHHSVTEPSTNPFADMRVIETIGMNRFGQFSYSFCCHPDGTILEGCGTRVGAHTAKRNSTSFGICLIGNYDQRAVNVAQVDAVRWLIAHLNATGKLKPGVYPTGGHRDVSATACPGDNAYRLLDQFRIPWCEPVPETSLPPATATDYPDGEDTLVRHDMNIRLDDQGNGWTRIDVPSANVVSIVTHGPYPPADGYWNAPVLSRQDREGDTVVVATEGPPGVDILISVWTL